MALYNAVQGVADPVKFTSSMTAVDAAFQRVVTPGVLSGLTVDGTGTVQPGEAMIGHVVAIAAATSVAASLSASTTNYVYIQMPASPACVGTDGRDVGTLVTNVTGIAPINSLLLATITTGVAAAITSVNTAPAGRVTATLALIHFADAETPSGTINGTNTTFTLAHVPVSGSLRIYIGGTLQNPSTYTLAGSTITFTTAPATGAWLTAFYRY